MIFELTHLRCEGCPSDCAKHANTANGEISSMGIYFENVEGDSRLFCGIHPFDLSQCVGSILTAQSQRALMSEHFT